MSRTTDTHDPVKPTLDEMEKLRRWVEAAIQPQQLQRQGLPLSLRYGGTPLADVWQTGIWEQQTRALDDRRTEHVVTCQDPQTGLQLRWQAIEYGDYPAVEWVLDLVNTGEADTPILSDIQALDVFFPAGAPVACHVHHARGGLTQADDFEPLDTPLTLRQGGGRLDLAART
ncbi:MAG: hypothetical protein ACM30E_12275, partial [Nitrososphaerales archaeon]